MMYRRNLNFNVSLPAPKTHFVPHLYTGLSKFFVKLSLVYWTVLNPSTHFLMVIPRVSVTYVKPNLLSLFFQPMY